jgi:hypothetical protein
MARVSVRTLRSPSWVGTDRRARSTWLIIVPPVGEFMATSANAVVPFDLPLPLAQLLASGAPALVAVWLVLSAAGSSAGAGWRTTGSWSSAVG